MPKLNKKAIFESQIESNTGVANLSSGTTSQPRYGNELLAVRGRNGDAVGTHKKPFRFMPKSYTQPVIRRFKDKWYIEYYFSNPFFGVPGQKEFERFKVYEDMNRYQGHEQEIYAVKLRDAIEINLQGGYNPYEEMEKKKAKKLEEVRRSQLEQSETMRGKPIIMLLDLFVQAKIQEGLKKKSIEGILTPVNHFKKWLGVKEWLGRGVKEFTEDELKEWLDYMQKDKKWLGKTYNTNKDYMIAWFAWFQLEKHILLTPITGRIKPQKTNSTKNEYYNEPIKSLVRAELEKQPLLKWACEFVYYAAVRSYMELSQIKIGDIDLPNRVIKIKESVGKKGYRFIPICDELSDLLTAKNLGAYHIDDYLFGRHGQISPERMDKNYLSRRYALLRVKIGIGQEYTIYSWKHSRVVELKNAGYKDAEIQNLTGHTDSKSFDAYSRNFGLSLATKLKGKTIEF